MARWIFPLLLTSLLLTGRAAPAEDTYAVLVGVSDYDPKQLRPLRFARPDIVEFREVLLSAGVPEENVVLMHDDPQTLSNLRYAAEADKIRDELRLILGGIGVEDSLIIAFAGHGVQFKGEDEHYFCPLDARLDDPDRTTLISLSEVYASLEDCPARRKLLLVDACRNDPRTDLARTAGAPDLESVTLPQLAEPPEGVVALFSCAAGQQAFEHPDLAHGVFFYHVLEAFRGQADDGDSQLTLDELLAFTKSKTRTFARLELGALQTPRQRGFFDGEWILREIARGGLVAPFSEAAAKEAQRTAADQLGIDVVETNGIGMRLTLIPPGEFQMGSGQSPAEVRRLTRGDTVLTDSYDVEDEHPQHTVRITRPYFMGVHEVSQGQWATLMGTSPSDFSTTGEYADYVTGLDTSRFPVERVSWYDAIDFCNTLSRQERLPPYYRLSDIVREDGWIAQATVSIAGGSGYRLPTEAEWEYACRAGTTSPFHFGFSSASRESNVPGSSPYATDEVAAYLGRTTAIGSYPANPFGLHDMHGNVWEWCFDAYDREAYRGRGAVTSDPVVVDADGGSKVIRGGSWLHLVADSRSASRYPYSSPWADVGFRVVRNP